MVNRVRALTLLDGGMGRELKRVGAPFQQPEWSALALMQAPERVEQVHRSFIDAGAQVITTNNYAVVPFHIGEQRFAEQGEALTVLSGQLARAAAGDSVRVGGCLPPLRGSYRPDRFDAKIAESNYPTLVKALEPFVDLWQAETMSCVDEARAVAAAVEHSEKPLWISFTLLDDVDIEQPCLRSGESLQAALDLAVEVGAEALLFNCSLPEVIGQAIAQLGPLRDQIAPELELGGYGNTFTPRDPEAEANAENAEMREEVSPEHYAEMTAEWQRDGASILGGCCGIGPAHIAAIAQLNK